VRAMEECAKSRATELTQKKRKFVKDFHDQCVAVVVRDRSRGRHGEGIGGFPDGPNLAIDRDRGAPHDAAPPTPPYIRVGIRRFENTRRTGTEGRVI